MSTALQPIIGAIDKAKDKFIAAAGDLLQYEAESVFAMQALAKTDYSVSIATKNPQSVQLAMRNVAATGLTLNPAYKYAYLVPRDGAIVLDISYKGLIKIATDCGAILWARADVVHEADQFLYHGPASAPEHTCDPFKPVARGVVVGAYCIAKTRDGDVLTEVLPIEEIEKIRGKSDLYTKKNSGPWVEWFTEMCRKSVIKRAAKTWPYTGKSGKLYEAIELANAGEGGYTLEAEPVKAGGGKPREGFMEQLDADRQEWVRVTAATAREYMDGPQEDWDVKGALDYIARRELSAEEQIAMYDLLTSAMRTALKVGAKTIEHMS